MDRLQQLSLQRKGLERLLADPVKSPRAWAPEAETGVSFNDPQLAIRWPLPPLGLSEQDLALPLLEARSA